METTYTVYRTDGTMSCGEVDWPENPSLRQIEAVVEPLIGGELEHVRVLDPAKVEADEIGRDDYRDLFVDEMGHQKSKSRNDRATVIYRANWLRAEGGEAEELPWIAGDAVLFDRVIWR